MKHYTHEQRMKAVLLYEKSGSATSVIRELGYPVRSMLYLWIEEYKETGKLHHGYATDGVGNYSDEEKRRAGEHYKLHGRSIERTIATLGYPKKSSLNRWIQEDRKNEVNDCEQNESLIEYAQVQIVEATIAYCAGEMSVSAVAKTHGVGVERIHKCAMVLLGKEREKELQKSEKTNSRETKLERWKIEDLLQEQKALRQEVQTHKDEIYHLRLERDVLEKAGEIIKKARASVFKQ